MSSLASNSVPREFLGRARELRSLLGDTETLAIGQMLDLIAPLHKRAQRSATPDRADLAHVARAWPTLPPYGRLSLAIQQQRTHLDITEIRAGACRLQGYTWEEHEPGVAINQVKLMVKRCHLTMDTPIVAVIGLHALARRISRAWANDTATILSELTTLALHANSLKLDRQFSLSVLDGRYVGEQITVEGQTALRVQTFLNH